MRITGGVWCSRRLRGPGRSIPLRPTPDATRERAFAVLGEHVVGARVLDLFAGTGAIGLEALSRGAASVTFVEQHRAAARLIRANLEGLGVPEATAVVLVREARRAVPVLARRGEAFDLIWADPPFASWERGLEALAEARAGGILAADAVACLECPDRAALELPVGLELLRDLTGSGSRVVLLRPAG